MEREVVVVETESEWLATTDLAPKLRLSSFSASITSYCEIRQDAK